MATEHIKRCPTLLVIREKKTYPTVRHYHRPTGIATIGIIAEAGKDVEQQGFSDWGWECNLVQLVWKTIGHCLPKQKYAYPMI